MIDTEHSINHAVGLSLFKNIYGRTPGLLNFKSAQTRATKQFITCRNYELIS